MIAFDREVFDRKCEHIIKDINTQKLTSTSWIWIMSGAAIGFIASCFRRRKINGIPER